MYRERFLMVRQRVHRHDLFRPPIIESSRREYIKLSPLDSLVSYMRAVLFLVLFFLLSLR